MRKYLPSKEFIRRVIIIAGSMVIIFGIYKTAIYIKNKVGVKKQGNLVIKSDVIQKDSNNNGIPDWEESLWGLDPRRNGDSNKEFILAQREELAKENNTYADPNQPLSENETLSREFFSVIMSLQESGNLDETSLQSVSDTIGQKIIATPLPDAYTKTMLSTIKTNPENTTIYSDALANLLTKYTGKDIGKELTYISVGLTNNDTNAFAQASTVATAYKSLGKELMKIQVPNTFGPIHLSLANDYEKVGESIDDMTRMIDDPIGGMKAVINYKKYTDALVLDMTTLSKDIQ